jgi:bacteriorhodopsin
LRGYLPSAAIAICERQTSLISTLRLEEENMLGFLALVLIVLWLLGFLAFHVSTGLIHVLLVVGVIMLVFHFLRGSPRTV